MFMKNLKLFLLFTFVLNFGLIKAQISSTLTPNPLDTAIHEGQLDVVFDQQGRKYKLDDIRIQKTNQVQTPPLLCSTSSGYFNLYFDAGCGMDGSTQLDIDRRNVICQVFADISAFINSPLSNSGNRVNIWIRDINPLLPGYTPWGNPNPAATSGALGMATSFHCIPSNYNSQNISRIADNEIWKTIHAGTDSYQNVSLPLTATGGTFYHGAVAFNFSNLGINWNTNLSLATAPATLYDLYSVALHEVTHALGFATLIGSNGASSFGGNFNYYSRYDLFLKNNSLSQKIITNTGSCSLYDFKFNPLAGLTSINPGGCVSSSPTDNTICGSAATYVGSTTVPVFTPNCFEASSSLSHFEDQCYPNTTTPLGNNLYFVMSNANGTGAVYTKRHLTPEERLVFCDLGYNTNNTFGSIANNNLFNYSQASCTGIDIAGINDGLTPTGAYIFTGDKGTPISIPNILTNDRLAVSYECLSIVYGAGTFNSTSGSGTFQYTPSSPGHHLLSYIPVASNGDRGNITYIYVFATVPICPNTCNLVPNGDFEQYTSIPNSYSQISRACGWQDVTASGSADYFHTNSPSTTFQVPCNHFGYQPDNLGRNAYAGFESHTGGGENIYAKLASPLLPNTSYQLKIDVSLAEGASNSAIPLELYLSPNIPITAGSFPFVISNPAMLFTSTSPITNYAGWTTLTFNFTTGAVSGEQYISIGNLTGLPITTVPPAAQGLSGCNYYNANSPNYHTSYYFLDNVSLLPSNSPVVSGTANPNSVCPWAPVTLNGTGAISYLWLPNNISGSNITVYPPVSTNYIVIGTDINGCKTTANVLVNVSQVNINLTSTNILTCGGGVNINVSGASTYVLQPGNISTSGPSFNVNPLVPTVYTVFGTDINGCTGSAQITVQPFIYTIPCTNAHTIGTSMTIPVAGMQLSGSYSNYNFTCLGDITIPGNLTASFTNCTFLMSPSTRINVTGKATLNILNCHLYGCDKLWDGIYLKGQIGGNLNINNSVIEDANIAIWVPAAGAAGAQNFPNKIRLINCLFNQNRISVEYLNNNTNTLQVSNSLFTSRCLNFDPPFVPLPGNIGNVANFTANIETQPFSQLLPNFHSSFTETNPHIGLLLHKYSSNAASGTQITLNTRNTFDLHTIGIETLNFSGLDISKQAFTNGVGNAFNDKTGHGSIGLYVHNVLYQNNASSYIGNVTIGGPNTAKNYFNNLDYGIYCGGDGGQSSSSPADSRFNINNNSFTKIKRNGITFFNYGSLVNNVVTRTIQNNTFSEVNAWGIYMLNSLTSNTKIQNNTFTNPVTPPVTTLYGGVYIGEIKNPTTALYDINNNTMSDMVNGIKCENLASPSIANNNIQLGQQYHFNGNLGIQLINSQKPVVLNNNITGFTTPGTLSVDQAMYVLDCPTGIYKCNTFKNTFIGTQFSGQNVSTTLFENTYEYNLAGVLLTKQGFIDIQDDPSYAGQPADNRFVNYGASQYQSYCSSTNVIGTNGALSPFYTRTSGTYVMVNNGADLGAPASVQIPIFLVANPLPQTNTYCSGPLLPKKHIKITDLATQIVNPGIYNQTDIRDNNISRRQLYKLLETESVANGTLTAFKNSSANNSVGQFSTFDNLTTEYSYTKDAVKLSQASSLNNNIVVNDFVDGYQKQLNSLFVSFLTNNGLNILELNQLRNIASLCPHTDGTSIWEARTFIKLFDSTEYVNVCEQTSYPIASGSQNRLATPMVSETVDTQIKGLLIPNPNNGNFSIVLNEDVQDLKIEVYDVNSRLVCSNSKTNNSRVDILCDHLNNGVYFVKVFINNTYNETHRLIITK